MPGLVLRLAAAALALAWAAGPSAVYAQDSKPLKVRFYSADADRTLIGGIYHKPLRSGKRPGKRPGVVMLHGCAGLYTRTGKLRPRPRFWSRWLLDKGYAVLMADSFTPRGHGSICSVAARPLRADTERPFDAYGALRFLQAQPEIIADRIALMGWSNGAMTLFWALKRTAPQRPRDLVHDFRAAVAFYPGCNRLKKGPYGTSVPILLQLGLADDWTPARHCLDLVARTRGQAMPLKVDTYENAYHGFDNPSSAVRTVLTRNGNSERRVHVGTNLAARNAAVVRVEGFLAGHLTP